jgi:hypothetical protein
MVFIHLIFYNICMRKVVNILPFEELNHGSPMNDGMTLSGWLESHKDDAQSESMDWETSVSDN